MDIYNTGIFIQLSYKWYLHKVILLSYNNDWEFGTVSNTTYGKVVKNLVEYNNIAHTIVTNKAEHKASF